MLLLDADVLLIDLRYTSDARFSINRRAVERIRTDGVTASITSQALLETVGILSFNLSPSRIPRLLAQLCLQYQLTVVPDVHAHPAYAGCMVQEVVDQMTRKMALGDAVQAVQIAQHVSGAECLLTWNAKHFTQKLVIPARTPEEWLNARQSALP